MAIEKVCLGYILEIDSISGFPGERTFPKCTRIRCVILNGSKRFARWFDEAHRVAREEQSVPARQGLNNLFS